MTAPEPAAGAFIPWHRRLEARVLFAVTLIAGVSLLAILFATSRSIQSYSLERSADDLRAGRTAFNRLVDTRGRFAADMTRLIAELPVFRAQLSPTSGVATDAATIAVTAEEYRGKLGADFSIVTDAQGTWIGQPGWHGDAALASTVTASIAAARSGRGARDIVSLPDGLYLIVAEPARFAEEVLGTITAGYRLDDRIAEELSLVAHSDVNLLCADGRLCGSSLPPLARSDLIALLQRDPASLGASDDPPQLRHLGQAAYVSALYPLLPDSGRRDGGRLLLMQPWQPTQEAVDQMQGSLLWVGAGTFVIAIAGSLAFSRGLTRPLRTLADVSNQIAAGQWTGRVPLDGPAEARLMASAFNHMTATLGDRSEQLQDAYDRFRAVTESANDAIVSVDGDGRIVFWNRRAEEVFGYAEAEAAGRTLTMLVPERYLQADSEILRQALAGEDAEWIGRTVEISGRRRDGGETPLELSLSTWKTGGDLFYTGVLRDITERKRAEDALRQRDEQLRQAQKMEAIGRLAGGIAHDFNNLLTAILGYTDFLLEDAPPELRPDIEGIQKAGQSAVALTRQLLTFSRKQVLQPAVLDLNAVAAGTDKLLRRLIGEDVELVMRLAPDLPRVHGDAGQLEQVILNLAVNARDAMPGGGRLTIATSAVDHAAPVTSAGGLQAGPGRYAVLSVSDTGTGMTDEVRLRIFEPFFTTKGVGEGTGLGLATVYGIVQQSHGYIDVSSQPGAGTAFHIGLPATSASETAVDTGAHASTSRVGGSETLLIVEDSESVRVLAAGVLRRAGYRVLEAENGEQGLEVARAHGPDIDLVITDIVMPVLGGREMAARLNAARPGLRIIFTSAYTDDRIGSRDAIDFIQKPFSPAALNRLVRDVLDRPAPGQAP